MSTFDLYELCLDYLVMSIFIMPGIFSFLNKCIGMLIKKLFFFTFALVSDPSMVSD